MKSSVLACLLALSMPAVSLADDPAPEAANSPAIQLRPSVSFLHGFGETTNAFGVGLDYIHYPTARAWNLGAFAEGFAELDGAFRVAGGLRVGLGGFGLRLGLAHRTEADGFSALSAVQLGKVFNWGPVGMGWRVTIPFHHVAAEQGLSLRERSVEFAFTLSVGWSFTVLGERPSWGCHHHRQAS